MSRIVVVAIAVLAVLCLPALAGAHIGQVAVGCEGVTFSYELFPSGPNPVSYEVRVDGALVASGVGSIDVSGTITVPLELRGTRLVEGSTSWVADGGGSASGSATVECLAEEPPPPPPPPTPRCPPGMTPTAGKDGQPGNDECEFPAPATTVPTPPSLLVPLPRPQPPPPVIRIGTPIVTVKPKPPKVKVKPPKVKLQPPRKPRPPKAKPKPKFKVPHSCGEGKVRYRGRCVPGVMGSG